MHQSLNISCMISRLREPHRLHSRDSTLLACSQIWRHWLQQQCMPCA